MFDTLIVQPIFNLLALIYALLPGHNFGLAVIIFTIVVRLLLWPLVKKQMHQVKLMRKLQPEIKRIEKEAKGDKRKKSLLMMELYKERGVNPFASIGILLLQLPILLGLFWGLQRVLNDPAQLEAFAYPFIQSLGWMQQLAANIDLFDATLFGLVDLTRPALGAAGLYIPALLIVVGSAVTQYFQSVQLMPNTKDSRSLRAIFKDASAGKQPEQSEINAAMGRSMKFLLPAMILLFTVYLPSALALYWFVSGLVALGQQTIILRRDVEEMEEIAEKPAKKGKGAPANQKKPKPSEREKQAVEAEVVPAKSQKKPAKSKAGKKKRKKR
jgi:YidC/Oxa1 family membrane protein insertase